MKDLSLNPNTPKLEKLKAAVGQDNGRAFHDKRMHSVGLFLLLNFGKTLRPFLLVLLVCASLVLASNLISPSSALAQSTSLPSGSLTMPLEGSSIFNRASVTYFSQSAVEQQQVFSNSVEVKVAAVSGVTLTQNQTALVNPGMDFRFPHIVMNTGNTASSYIISITPGATVGVLQSGTLQVVIDENGNGLVDANEQPVTLAQNGSTYTFTFPVLPPANMGQFIVVGKVQGNATSGEILDLTVTAATPAVSGQVPVVVSNTDRVMVTTGAVISPIKSATPSPIQGELTVGSTVRYQVSGQNVGVSIAAPIERAVLSKTYLLNSGSTEGPISGTQSYPIKVDGVDTSLVLLRDLIPPGMTYRTGSLTAGPAGAIRLYRYAGEPPFTYRTDGSFPNVVEVAVGLNTLASGGKISLEFEATVRSDYSGSFFNTAEQFYMGVGASEDAKRGPSASNTVAHIVSPLGKPDLTVSKTHSRNFGLEMEEEFTIIASNVGQWATTGAITITDTFPPNMQYLGATGQDWVCPPATGTYIASVTCSYNKVLNGTSSGAGNAAIGQPTSPLIMKVKVLSAALPAGQDTRLLTNKVVVSGGGEGMATLDNNQAEDAVVVERLATVAGRVWLDQNTDRRFQDTEPTLAGWRAQLILIEFVNATTGESATSQVYALNEGRFTPANTETIFTVPDGLKPVVRDILTSNPTLADGKYLIKGVRPRANYALRFISPTGAVFSLPVNGEQGNPTSSALISPDLGSLMVLNLAPGQNVIEQSLPLAPTGVVYDVVTRLPVAGAIVRLVPPVGVGFDPDLHLVGGAAGLTVTTDANGHYQFRLGSHAPRGTYTLEVTPPSGYAGVSWSVPPAAERTVQGGPLDSLKIQEQYSPPIGAQSATYHLAFNWAGQANYIVNNHIPLEKAPTDVKGALVLKKEANKQQVEVVDFVDYTVTVTNSTNAAIFDVTVLDTPAFGFTYLPGSAYWTLPSGARINTTPEMVKQNNGSYQMRFNLQSTTPILLGSADLKSGQFLTLKYRLNVTPAALQGDGVNSAIAQVTQPAKISSQVAKASVKVTGGVFAEEAFLIGKVFLDCNRSGIQEAGELGIPGVRLFLQDGSFVITDNEGKYSIYGLKPRTHVLKLDMVTLPAGAEVGEIDNRSSSLGFAGEGDSKSATRSQTRFIDLKKGELHKGNFAITSCTPAIQMEVENRRTTSAKNARSETKALVASAERFKTDTKAAAQNTTNSNSLSATTAPPSTGMIDRETGKAKDQVQSPAIAATQPKDTAAIAEKNRIEKEGIDLKEKTDGLTVSIKAPAVIMPGLLPPAVNFTNIATPLETLLEQETSNELAFLNLRDGQKIAFPQTSVQVRGVLGTKLELRVNGQSVSETRVGKRSKVSSKQIEAWEYVAVDLEVGENTLDLLAIDSLGNERARRSIKIYTPGKLARIQFEPIGSYVADGRTSQAVRIKLEDAAGVPVMVRTPVTLFARNIEWAASDLDPREEGVQVFIQGGQADLLLGPKVAAGEVTVLAQAEDIKAEHKLVYIGELRPLVAVGVVEGTVRFSNSVLSSIEPVRSSDPFERELSEFAKSNSSGKADIAARAAFFLKGKVLGKYLLTAAYDSEKNKEDTLFRDIKPDAFYPIYGDSSTRGFDAQSAGRLYVRIDKERNYLLLGDYSTASDGVRQLNNYARGLNGLKANLDEALSADGKTRVLADAYFARTDQTKVTAPEIQGTGLTGPFTIAGIENRLENSEVVELVVRDRLRPDVILSITTLGRFADYTIDALSHQLRLIAPLASVDASGNPQYLRVSFEVKRGGKEFNTYGGSAQIETPILQNGQLKVGVAAQENKDPAKPTRGYGAFAEVKVNDALSIQAEIAKSRVEPGSDPSAPTGQDKEGSAMRLQASYKQGGLQATASVVQASKNYESLGSGATAGQRSAKLDVNYNLTSTTALTAQGLYTKDNIQNTLQQGLTLGVKQSLGQHINIELGARRFENKTFNTSLLNSDGTTSTGTKVEDGETLIAKLSARAPFAPSLSTQLEWEQDTSAASKRRLQAGLDYKIGLGRLYAKHEWISSLGNSYSLNNESSTRRSTLGFSADYTTSGSVYGEYRIPDATDAKPAQAALGIKHKFALAKDWNLALQAERTQPTGSVSSSDVAGGSSSALPEKSTALSAAVEYTGNPDLRYTQRLEWRKTQNEKQFNLLLAGAYHLSENWSLLARYVQERRRLEAGASSGDRYDLLRLQVGAAYRPVDWDAFNALAKLEFAQNKDSVSGASTKTDSAILSLHANWQPMRRLTLNGRYAAKIAKVLGADGLGSDRNSAHLFYARASYDLTDRIDASLQAFGMSAKGGTRQYGLGLEAGYLVHANLWLSLGYNFSGFVASDLASDLATQRGAYLRLRMKFDENGF